MHTQIETQGFYSDTSHMTNQILLYELFPFALVESFSFACIRDIESSSLSYNYIHVR